MPSGPDPYPRTLHIVASRALAGTERHVLGLVTELRALDCPAGIVHPPGASPLRDAVHAAGIPVLPGPGVSRIDIVHAHDGRSSVLAAGLAAALGAAFIRTQHFVRPASATRGRFSARASLAAHRLLNRRLDGYVTVSRAVARAADARGDVGRGIAQAVVGPGIVVPADDDVEPARARRRGAAAPVVVSAGRIEPERRLDVLIEAIPRVRREVPSARFVIAGTGGAEAGLRRAARRCGVGDAITWTGWLPDIAPELAGGYAYVNTWPEEGFGMATAEAMAWGLPVVAADGGALPELVADGVTGQLVPPGDPAALAEALVTVLGDRPRAEAMGAAGRRRAIAEFSLRATAEAMLAFYRQTLRARMGR